MSTPPTSPLTPPDSLSSSPLSADFLIVGGGTAGCILAARLSQDPSITVILLEAGPSDDLEPRAASIRRWEEMLESEYDLDYRCVAQERGNSDIRQTRMQILGGCSTTNTMISWRPLAADLDEWSQLGVQGWGIDVLSRCFDQLRTPIHPVAQTDRNPFVAQVIESAHDALGLPTRTAWNSDPDFAATGEGTGFFEIGYTPETNQRSSSSSAYLRDVVHTRTNLHIYHGILATKILFDNLTARGVQAVGPDSILREFYARREVIVCAGAIDSPKLLQLSGIGPQQVLEDVGVDVVVDLPGVGENLMDHAEGLVVWEVSRDVPATCASGWDAGAAIRLYEDSPPRPDVLMHFPVTPYVANLVAKGIELPSRVVGIAPNVAKPRSRGTVRISSNDPQDPPLLDYRYFTDPLGEDEKTLLAGVRLARRIAGTAPFSDWLVREVFPGPHLETAEELSAAQRAIHNTVYHVSGTCKMGSAQDSSAVLDSRLRVVGVTGLRIVDASVFPTIPSVNPVGTLMAVAERAAEIVAEDNATLLASSSSSRADNST